MRYTKEQVMQTVRNGEDALRYLDTRRGTEVEQRLGDYVKLLKLGMHDQRDTLHEALSHLGLTVQGVVPDHVVRDENALRDIINNNLMLGLLPFDNTDAGSALYLAANRLRALVGNSGYALLDVDGKTIIAEYRLEDVAWRAAIGDELIWLARAKVQVNDRFVVNGQMYLAGAPGWCVIDPNEPVGSPSIG